MLDKRLMKMCPESRKYIAGKIVFQLLELFLNALMVLLLANGAARLYEGSWKVSGLVLGSLGVVLMVAARGFVTRQVMQMGYLASRTVKQVMRERIYEKLLRLASSYREVATTAELVQESVEGVEQLESYFGQYVPQFFYAFLAPLCLFLLFGFGGSWRVATVLLVCVPLIPMAIVLVQKIAKRILSRYWGQYTRLGSAFLENLQGMTTLKIYQADEYKNQEMNRESEEFRRATMAVLTMQLNSVVIMDLFTYGGTALGILLAARDFAAGRMGLSSVLFMILLCAEFFLPMRRLGSYFHVAMNGMAASDKIFRFLKEAEPGTKLENATEGDICLKRVSFSYDGEREVLQEVSLRVSRHSFVGIVGESGSGKSTIAALCMGRRTPTGEITLGGKRIGDLSEESLMKCITYVGSSPFFFKGTVRENLLLAKPGAGEEELWKVLKDCALDTFLREGAGLDTRLLENAQNLSGGQRQRLALARALLHDTPIYIFDEATSNIDMESEAAILKAIHSLEGKKTIVMITHRLANVVLADTLYVLEKGRLVQTGSHEKLLLEEGAYKRLFDTQSALEGYRGEGEK